MSPRPGDRLGTWRVMTVRQVAPGVVEALLAFEQGEPARSPRLRGDEDAGHLTTSPANFYAPTLRSGPSSHTPGKTTL